MGPTGDGIGIVCLQNHHWRASKYRPSLATPSIIAFQIAEVVDMYRESATGLVNTYLSSVGQRTNEVMKTLTIVGSIFIPLTFVAGNLRDEFRVHARATVPLGLPHDLVLDGRHRHRHGCSISIAAVGSAVDRLPSKPATRCDMRTRSSRRFKQKTGTNGTSRRGRTSRPPDALYCDAGPRRGRAQVSCMVELSHRCHHWTASCSVH